ncbi:MAG: DUF4258 domain-containing protein, partial [Hyphomicrobiales bacterium]|nr:DUF4258 domain-containing protein [Hyphomicrobiales bacterium]
PAEATNEIHRLASNPKLQLTYSRHYIKRLEQKGLFISDFLHVMKRGVVHLPPENATQPGLYKYEIQGRSPNSTGRIVRVVVIPDEEKIWMKIVTIMFEGAWT